MLLAHAKDEKGGDGYIYRSATSRARKEPYEFGSQHITREKNIDAHNRSKSCLVWTPQFLYHQVGHLLDQSWRRGVSRPPKKERWFVCLDSNRHVRYKFHSGMSLPFHLFQCETYVTKEVQSWRREVGEDQQGGEKFKDSTI